MRPLHTEAVDGQVGVEEHLLLWAPIGVAAAIALVCYFVVAVAFHIRAGDAEHLPIPLAMAVIAATALACGSRPCDGRGADRSAHSETHRPLPGTRLGWRMKIDGNLLRCSFCDRLQLQVGKLIAGRGVYICDGCVALARGWPAVEEPQPRCGFCGMTEGPVQAPAARGPAAVCAECLDLCNEIIAEEAEEG